jgi:tetratricopeptide (TPR) repeat protein
MNQAAVKDAVNWHFWRSGPPDYWNNLCREHFTVGQWERAEEDCKNAAKSDPHYAAALTNLAELHRARVGEMHKPAEIAHYQTAEKNYREALRREPDFFPALKGLIELLCDDNVQRFEDAKTEATKAAVLFPWSSEPLLLLAQIYRVEGRSDLQREIYQQVIKKDPDNSAAWSALGDLDSQSQALDASINEYLIAYERGGDAITLAALGELVQMRGSPCGGLELMLEALKDKPALADDEVFQLHLGDAHLATNHFEDAIKAYLIGQSIDSQKTAANSILANNSSSFNRHLSEATFGFMSIKHPQTTCPLRFQ